MVEELYININPLQTGGKASAETRKAVFSWMDGYAVCDSCKGSLRTTDKPPIKQFIGDVASFLGMDDAMLTNGAREAKFAVIHSITKKGDWIVADGNAHYSTLVAAERNRIKVHLTKTSGAPTYEVIPESFALAIEEGVKKYGKLPALAVATHVDGNYGNVLDAKRISEICHSYDVPVLLNTAYSSGRMPVDGKALGADFMACSAHKSWATGGGNAGILAMQKEYRDTVLKFSDDFPVKPLENLGCSTRGSAIVALISSFPMIKKRVKKWDEEVKHAQYVASHLVDDTESLLLGTSPKKHDIIALETPGYDNIAKTHKKRGYFLTKELKAHGIVGIKPGRTKKFKFSTYGLTDEQTRYLVESFIDIKEKYNTG
ncbi:MAG: O-phospho-L-seryl-tRNA:Cys-tRNA synthase [Candidatus Methanofastidiosia archaeon]